MTAARERGTYFEWAAANTLRPYKIPAEQDLKDGESDNDWAKQLGYDSEGFSGIPDMHELRWFGRKEPGGHAFVAMLVESDSWRAIFIPSFDALLRFRGMIAPIISQSMLEVHLLNFEQIAGKAFRAWHGHHETRACDQCDPAEAKRQREEERRNRRDSKK